jgi:hypothetical protein
MGSRGRGEDRNKQILSFVFFASHNSCKSVCVCAFVADGESRFYFLSHERCYCRASVFHTGPQNTFQGFGIKKKYWGAKSNDAFLCCTRTSFPLRVSMSNLKWCSKQLLLRICCCTQEGICAFHLRQKSDLSIFSLSRRSLNFEPKIFVLF